MSLAVRGLKSIARWLDCIRKPRLLVAWLGNYKWLTLLLFGVLIASSALAGFLLVHGLPKKHKSARHLSEREDLALYVSTVKPILESRCIRCHGESKAKGGLRLDSPEAIRKGSDSGGILVPGDGANSLLVMVLSEADDKPRMPPSGEMLEAKQIAQIKRWIDGGAKLPGAIESPASIRTVHWAFQPPIAAAIPICAAANPIDAFLEARQREKGLQLNPPLAPALLLRRVTIDLTGLPPTLEETQAFQADPTPDAYERVIDRLLSSPAYGERWARHWMDIWRYSDPDGRKAKNDIWWGNAHIWRWRDWIVDALNGDVGYDQMVVSMLAGDEAAPCDPSSLAATGYLARNWFKQDRNVWLNNTVEHTSKAFLGLTISCARCHDHKFDPISQVDYYRFRAVFEPHDIRTNVLSSLDQGGFVARAFDAHPEAKTYVFVRGDDKTPDKSKAIEPGVPLSLGGALAINPPALPAGTAPSTGRRLALARWLTARENPLTARVAVNHIWARHFGRPLVDNVSDFGLRTAPPLQQDLLDYLAVELMEHKWSTKQLHRLIVTSAAYRTDSSNRTASEQNRTIDPENHYFWKMNSQRMQAEVLRDSLLSLAGVLDPTRGGPPLDQETGTSTARRSLYYRYSREDKMGFLTAFDSPGVEECYRRQESIVPQQALALENSAFAWDQARRIAHRLECKSSEDFITAAFADLLSRQPTGEERATCLRFLGEQEELLSSGNLTPFPPPAPPPAPVDPVKLPGLPLVLGKAAPLPSVKPARAPAALAREYLVHALLNNQDFISVR